MTTDEIITELKNLNEMDMQNVMGQTKEYIEDKSDYPTLVRRLFVQDEVDALESDMRTLKNDLEVAKEGRADLVAALKNILLTE